MSCWVRYQSRDGSAGFGVLEGTRISEYQGDMFAGPQPTGATLAAGEYTLQSPCTPSKIVALWNNFHALAEKLGKQAPAHALYLIKPGTSVIGHQAAIRRPAAYAGKIAFEGELGIVIGRRSSRLALADAGAAIFGYTCVNDVTAAEVLNENADFAQWCRSKGYDTFGCIGPVIATQFDWPQARVMTKLDGVERQNYPLSDMIFSPEYLVSQISHDMTLLPGDVIACGTSVGVGSIRDGAAVEVYIEGIGSLINVLALP
ncbi:MAG: fumarylacetoacetate hydrolase family protein [Steroidobacteraceae bacterium]|jgi:2-keto-4-pentenoate hydratase/2-oxohepta-3-ene-1,7-dioic acid hydratase in catechol pathway